MTDPHQPGVKLDEGKLKAEVLLDFSRALTDIARVGTYGAEKYTRGGWQYVPDAEERYFDAFVRHILAYKVEGFDQESGLDHLSHAAWNLLAVIELHKRTQEK